MRFLNRRFVIALLFVQVALISRIPLLAQNAGNRARISLSSPLIDLGTLCVDSVASYHFEFQSSGNVMLVVTDAQPSCPCIELNWLKGPIQPGEKGWLDLRFHAETPGPFDKAIWITSNATDSSGQMQMVELRVRGLVMAGRKR